jgi:hypothetical protein
MLPEDQMTMDDTPKAGQNLSGILAKLRAKYPELSDEPLMDQLAANVEAPAEAEEPDPNAFDADLRVPADIEPGKAPDRLKPKRKKPKMSELPAPDLSGVDIPEDINGTY